MWLKKRRNYKAVKVKRLVKQPTPYTCVPAVFSMLTDKSFEEIYGFFHFTLEEFFYHDDVEYFLISHFRLTKPRRIPTKVRDLEKRVAVLSVPAIPPPESNLIACNHCIIWDGEKVIDPMDPYDEERGKTWLDKPITWVGYLADPII